jgi:hypothetical protein
MAEAVTWKVSWVRQGGDKVTKWIIAGSRAEAKAKFAKEMGFRSNDTDGIKASILK